MSRFFFYDNSARLLLFVSLSGLLAWCRATTTRSVAIENLSPHPFILDGAKMDRAGRRLEAMALHLDSSLTDAGAGVDARGRPLPDMALQRGEKSLLEHQYIPGMPTPVDGNRFPEARADILSVEEVRWGKKWRVSIASTLAFTLNEEGVLLVISLKNGGESCFFF